MERPNPFKAADLDEFVAAFGDDPFGEAPRVDQSENGRFRRFTREEITARSDNLEISWLKDTSADIEDGLETPEEKYDAENGSSVELLRNEGDDGW